MSGHLDVDPGSPAFNRLGFGAVALLYQRLGYAVMATARRSKRPHRLMVHGVSWASRDPAMVDQVWGRDRLAGVAIATGQPSGLLVVDLDRHGRADGRLIWQSFLAANNLWADPGPWVQTPSGGEHRYYRLPPGVTVPTRPGLLDGVDFKVQGGYVVAPPSMVDVAYDDPRKPGQVLLGYVWHGCPCYLPPAPDWLLHWLLTAPPAADRGTNGHGGDSSGDLPDLAVLYAGGLPVGFRNEALLRLACQQFRLRGSHDPSGEARATIDRVLDATDRAGFPPAEIERTIASARRFIAHQEAEELAAWQSVYGRR